MILKGLIAHFRCLNSLTSPTKLATVHTASSTMNGTEPIKQAPTVANAPPTRLNSQKARLCCAMILEDEPTNANSSRLTPMALIKVAWLMAGRLRNWEISELKVSEFTCVNL